jgi:hypothetical protein
MNKTISFLSTILSITLLCGPALSQEKRAITLKDGTKVIGEIVSVENSVYTINSSVGQLQIKDQDITAMAALGAEPIVNASTIQNIPATSSNERQIKAAQQELMTDPNFMMRAKEISQDQEIVGVLSKPEIMQAVANRDFEALQANPDFKDLLNNPKIRDLVGSAAEKISQPNQAP